MSTQPTASRRVLGVVFDLDGTLIDSRDDLAAAVNHALLVNGLPSRPPEELFSFIGDGLKRLVVRASGLPPTEPLVRNVEKDALEYYLAHVHDTTTLVPGVREVLAQLTERQLPLALCTNKPRAATSAILKAFSLTDWFRCVIAGGDLPVMKPDPRVLTAIADCLEVAPTELVMVGDGPQDVLTGHAVGARTVAIEFNIAPLASVLAAKPDVVLAGLNELPSQLHVWAETSSPEAAAPQRQLARR